MSTRPPSDPEEADAVHRRFLPPAQIYRNFDTMMKLNEEDGDGDSYRKVNGDSPSSRSHLNNFRDMDGAEIEPDRDGDNNESTFTPLNQGKPDYGTTSINISTPGIEENEETDHELGADASFKGSEGRKEESYGFDYNFVRRFHRLHGVLFLKFCSTPTILFVFLLAFALLSKFCAIKISY